MSAFRRSAEVNDAWMALRVNAINSVEEKPNAAAMAYSRPMVVQIRTGLSVLSVMGMPDARNCRIGWSSYDGTAPRTTLQERLQ